MSNSADDSTYIDRAISAYYDSLTDEEREEKRLWAGFAESGHGRPDPKLILVNGTIYLPKVPPESGFRRQLHFLSEWARGVWYKTFG